MKKKKKVSQAINKNLPFTAVVWNEGKYARDIIPFNYFLEIGSYKYHQ